MVEGDVPEALLCTGGPLWPVPVFPNLQKAALMQVVQANVNMERNSHYICLTISSYISSITLKNTLVVLLQM